MIKALEWDKGISEGFWTAETPFGQLQVLQRTNGKWTACVFSERSSGSYSTVEEAKAEVQRQFEEQVRSLFDVTAVLAAIAPLVAIADAYDENELDDEARKFWGTGENTTPPEQIELYTGRGGKRLLTLADCLKAREASR